MGLLIGVGNTKPTFPYDYYYGIEWDTTAATPVCTRVGRTELHQALPIQSKMRRCIISDAGALVTYLGATDSTKTDTGAAADLSGAAGQVMVEIPAHYRKFEVDGTKIRCLISEHNLPGFVAVPKTYRSAYEATVDRTTAATPKLASVVNLTTAFRGGNNTAAWDATYRTLLGRPATAISLTGFRTYARNRGTAGFGSAGWNCDVYGIQKTCYWLYCIEYANFNCQAIFNAQLDANSYRQGGLGNGVTTLDYTKWSNFNSANPFVPCGTTNGLGNASGVVEYTMPDEYDTGTTVKVSVPSYRGLENPFGHTWSWTDGCKCRVQSEAEGGISEFFTCENPANFQDTDYTNYDNRGRLPRASGWLKSLLVGEFGENLPATIGGSSTTYQCDYFYTSIPDSGVSQRGVFFGGSACHGASAGFACANTTNTASAASTSVGSRLCFIPA